MTKRLSSDQRKIFELLRERGQWYPRCGWIWDTPEQTLAAMDKLVEKGYATKSFDKIAQLDIYKPVKAQQ